MVPRSGLAALLLLATVLAGCSGGGGGDEAPAQDVPELEVTETTGGIRGVVVDEAVRPIKGARVELVSSGQNHTTDETGLFAFSGLEAGTYFVKASHPLYAEQQQPTEVAAGVPDPRPVKFQLIRTILEQPYITTEKFDGFIVCSAGHGLVGYSEECGEGAGSPADSCFLVDTDPVPCQPNPVNPGDRIGGQGNNEVQYDFFLDSLQAKTILVELVWEPTAQTAASGQLLTYVSTGWLCDPFCGGDVMENQGGPSPLYIRIDNDTIEEKIGEGTMNTTAPITVFTWANPDTHDPATGQVPLATVILNQPYGVFVTKSYVLPLPEAWSFVNGDANPFT